MKIAIVVSRFNENITGALLNRCRERLIESGVPAKNLKIVWVPGAYELPFAAHRLARSKKYAAVIGLGCVIKGETSHDVHIATWTSVGIGQVSLNTGVPTIFGVLTPNSEAQAIERAAPGPLNRGREVAEAALEMIRLIRTKEI
jgi:6,7-dimethyl-8-ribityllumazine synthase